MLVIAVGGLTFMLLRGDKQAATPVTPAASATPDQGAVFAQVRDGCNTAAGFDIEDAGRSLILTVGRESMNADTMTCVFDRLGMPTAVREHVSTTRALDGQQTDQWPGYTARWTYHPDDGLQMTIRAA